MRYLVFPAFRSYSVLVKVGKYTKSNLLIYNFSMFGQISFLVTVNYDIISIQATWSLEKCDTTVKLHLTSDTNDNDAQEDNAYQTITPETEDQPEKIDLEVDKNLDTSIVIDNNQCAQYQYQF